MRGALSTRTHYPAADTGPTTRSFCAHEHTARPIIGHASRRTRTRKRLVSRCPIGSPAIDTPVTSGHTTNCSRHVGRVGALAVALGVGAAIASMPAVAFADTAGSPGSSAGPGPSASGNRGFSARKPSTGTGTIGVRRVAFGNQARSRLSTQIRWPCRIRSCSTAALTSRAGKRVPRHWGPWGHQKPWRGRPWVHSPGRRRAGLKSPLCKQPHPTAPLRRSAGAGTRRAVQFPYSRNGTAGLSRRRDSGRKRLLLELVDVHPAIGLQQPAAADAGQQRQQL